MSGRHAKSKRRRTALTASLFTIACSLPFALHANTHAVADTVHISSVTMLSTTSSKPAIGDGVAALERSAREIAKQEELRKRDHRIEVRQKLERLQQRRELARERAQRAQQREFTRWVMPINDAGWSASFGEAGSMWSSGYHTGQDFTAPAGTPVMAASGGTITFAGWSDAYGNKIEITHPDGNQTWYAHMSALKVTNGRVRPGKVIGYVGCTGNCFGTHLHFEFHPGSGDAADPVAWLRKQHAL